MVQAGFGAILVGLVQCVGVPKARRAMVLAALLTTDVQVSRHVPRLLLSLPLLGMVAWWAHRRGPGAGRTAIAVAALTIPLLAVVLVLSGVHCPQCTPTRHWSASRSSIVNLIGSAVKFGRRSRGDGERQRS